MAGFFLQAPDMAAILDLMGRLPLSSQAPLLAPRVRLAFFPKQTRPKIKRLDILCDRKGIDQRIIDPFFGHTTEGIEGATCTFFRPARRRLSKPSSGPPDADACTLIPAASSQPWLSHGPPAGQKRLNSPASASP